MRSSWRIPISLAFRGGDVENVNEGDQLEWLVTGRALGRVHPAHELRHQRRYLGAQLGDLGGCGKDDGLGGAGHDSDVLGQRGPGQLESADAGDDALDHRLGEGPGRLANDRIVGVIGDSHAGLGQAPGPFAAAPGASLLDDAESAQDPQVVGAGGRALADHLAGLGCGEGAGHRDGLDQPEPGRVGQRLEGLGVADGAGRPGGGLILVGVAAWHTASLDLETLFRKVLSKSSVAVHGEGLGFGTDHNTAPAARNSRPPAVGMEASMGDPQVLSFRPEAGQFAWTFGGVPPAARITPGTVLELWTEDCFAGRVKGPGDLVSEVCEFPFLNPQTGPFYVEGAEPGDTLAVHFVSLEPSRDWA